MSGLDERIAQLPPARRELLRRMLDRQARSPEEAAAASRARPAGPIPLSSAQRRLWFLGQLEPGSPAYNICRGFTFTGGLNVDVLRATLDALARRHEALRTRFLPGPAQEILPPSPFPLELDAVDALPPPERAGRLRALSAGEARRPFQLEGGPLARARLVRVDERRHLLLLTLHHAIADGWSMGVLQRELVALYADLSAGRAPSLPAVPLQHSDCALAEQERAGDPRFIESLEWWRRQLAGAPSTPALPVDRPRSAHSSSSGAVCACTLPAERVRAFAREHGATPFAVLLAAFQALLFRLSGEEDLIVGTPVANRGRPGEEGVVGCLANTLALRGALEGGLPFSELLRRTREICLGALAQQEIPFERVVEAVRPERSLGHAPLFQTMLSLAPAEPEEVPVAPGLQLRRETVDTGAAAFELSFLFEEGPELLRLDAEYDAEVLDGSTVARWVGYFERLLEGALASPDRPLSRLPLLPADERDRLLVEWNDTRAEVERGLDPPRRVERQAARTPDATALEQREQRLSWRELDGRANRLAHALRRHGVNSEVRVGLYLERSVDMAVAMLGVLKAGGAYVPIDPHLPAARQALLESDAAVAVRIVQPGGEARLPAGGPVLVPPLGGELEPRPPPAGGFHPEGLAYVLYTSGSTGRPKGVQVPRRAVIHLAQAMATRYALRPDDRVLQFASPGFDVAAEELFASWCAGATVVVWPAAGLESMADFTRAVDGAGLTVLNLPAAFFHAWVPTLSDGSTRFPRALRLLVAGSDQVSSAAVLQWRALAPPGVRLLAAYGVTEATVTSTVHEVDAGGPLDASRPVPVGRPVPNVQAYVLDAALEPVPTGVAGELYLGGDGLARGYLGQPALTAERFVPHPFSTTPGQRLYRTGDLARVRPGGTLELIGRADGQVKVRGYRVEPGEIEAALRGHPAVRDCAVVAHVDPSGEKRLAAYVVAAAGAPAPSSAELREHLAGRLPSFLVPELYVALERLPLTPSGKLDRRALPAPVPASAARAPVAPRTPEEELLSGLFAAVLGLEQVGVEDDFFALGGHSLLAAQAIARARSLLGVELPLRALFESPTVAGLAAQVARARQEASASPAPALSRAPRQGPLPLSFAQERLWLLERLQPGGAQYALPYAVRIRGALEPEVLARCLEELVARHEALRTTFPADDGHPRQEIARSAHVPLQVLDWRGRPDSRRAAEDFITAEAQRPFDLERGPLLRAFLLRTESDESVLLLSMHHIVADGWSLDVLERELLALHEALRRGEPSPLPAVPLQSVDYAAWQRACLQGAELDRLLAWWRDRLAGAPAALELPGGRTRPPVRSQRGDFQILLLGPAVRDALRALCRQEGVTAFMAMLAVFQAVLGRLGGQDDVVVGTPIAGRTRAEAEGVVGCFVNMLPLRTSLAGSPTFRQLLHRVRGACLGAYGCQELPFDRLVEAVAPERSPGVHPLFQATLTHHPWLPPRSTSSGLELSPIEVRTGAAKADLTFSSAEVPEGLRLLLEHATDVVEPAVAVQVLHSIEAFLEGALARPDERSSSLPLLSAADRQRLVADWNRTAADFPRDRCVPALFEEQARRTPAATALIFGAERLSYEELERRANQLAHHLRARGVGPEVLVGLCLERSPEMVVAVLGVLKAGGAYVPLDPAYPPERLSLVAEDARLGALVCHRGLHERLPEFRGPRVELDAERSEVATRSPVPPPPLAAPEHAAYVIYTSGSTGRPKGVVVAHLGLANFVHHAVRRHGLSTGDRVLQLASLGFDASVLETFTALLSGAALVLIPPEAVGSGLELGKLLDEQAITWAVIPPSLLEVVPEGEHPHLRTLLVGGEAAGPQVVARWAPGRRFINVYGPTETTVYATAHQHVEADGTALPLGRPIENAQSYVLDRHLQPVPPGAAGELYLGGIGLARGYLRRPDLTAERFIPHPFSQEPGARLYRTGDLVRWRADGEMEFLGRVDAQVKLRGHRIELGEVEAELAAHPLVREAAVVVREDTPGVRYLAAYVVLRDEAGNAEEGVRGIRRHLQQRLPGYMVPSFIVPLDAFPLTAHGKLDRRALPAPERGAPAHARTAPRTSVERTVAEVWAEVLGLRVDDLSADDGFFDLGGNSLLAIRATSRLQARYGVTLPARTLFEAPTLEALADALIDLELQGASAEALAALMDPSEHDTGETS